MLYTEAHPRAELKPWVAAHLHFRVEPGAPEMEHWIPLNGGVMLSLASQGDVRVTGPRTEPHRTRVFGGMKVWGSLLWPGAAPSLWSVDMESLRSSEVLAREILPDDWVARLQSRFRDVETEEQATRILDEAFLEFLPPARPPDDKVMQAVFRVLRSNGEDAIGDVADAVELSPRQLRRRFRREVGLTPKELARIQRMRASAVEAVADVTEPWIDIAAKQGYADQAHLIREFRDLLGLTPKSFESHFRRIQHRQLVR